MSPAFWGQPVYYSLADIPGPLDLVDVFRRANDIPADHSAGICATIKVLLPLHNERDWKA